MSIIEIIFWICIVIVFYTYIGYGIILFAAVTVKRAFCKSKQDPDPFEPVDVTLMICAYNEQDIVEMKMDNTNSLDYPKDKLHVVWVTDGSTDSTNEKLSHYPNVKVLYSPERKGKTAAINRGIKLVDTSLIIMTDANTIINPEAVKEVDKFFK